MDTEFYYVSSANNANPTDFIYQLTIPERHNRLGLYQIMIPKGFYSVNDNYNTFNVGSTQYTLAEGNYSTTSIRSALQTLVSGLTVTYSSITGKFTFSGVTNIIIPEGSDLIRVLGVPAGTHVCPFTGQNIPNLQAFDEVYITCDLVRNSQGNLFGNILERIFTFTQVDFANILYVSPSYVELAKRITTTGVVGARFKILSQDGTIIDTNGLPVSMTLVSFRAPEIEDKIDRYFEMDLRYKKILMDKEAFKIKNGEI